ncbi:MAG: anthranilate synthase component I [Rhodospirillales bacterium]|nr:anthranilate synthase component I [Rhodospirillales bacterium]MBO6786758.1 anthranilate synthase component I [Rhodospirillales bacterium]
MNVQPDVDAFRKLYESGKTQVLWSEIVADLETPVSAMLKLAADRPNSFLLESVEGGATRGRYSIIGFDPDLIWRCFPGGAEINRSALRDPETFVPCPVSERDGALASLRALVNECRFEVPENLPPMASGLVGYMAYDMVRLAERLPDDNPDTIGVPDSIFLRPTVMAIFDSLKDSVFIITPVWPADGVDAESARADAEKRIAATVDGLSKDASLPRADNDRPITELTPKSNMSREEFHQAVRTCVDYIHAGDAFQIVPSQRFSVPFEMPPFAFYRSLRRLNPSPYLFFLDFGAFQVVGSSPEILVRVRDGRITLRPLAGTRKRGATPEEDAALAEDLLSDPKELAEHLMLLDLGRNDVGRVAKIGTVKPTEQFTIEYYSHVMHISSNVEGDLADGKDALDALFAGFPAGTVSGAPKIRAMEIIDEVEPTRRGVYSGCIGYFGANGDMDSAIALRTGVIKDGTLYVQAGGGVVADSDPEFEYQESVNKSRALIRAAEDAVKFAG